MNDGEYWNPVLETMPREKIRQLQLRRFREIFTWAYEHSKFYRKLYSDASIEPGDIKTYDDIRKVPKIGKAMMRDVQGPGKEPFPYGDILCVPLEQVTASARGWANHARYGNTVGLRRAILEGVIVQPAASQPRVRTVRGGEG